jgi:uncharacterized membrane protein
MMLRKSILYLGDTNLESAAAYLAGLMHRWGWTFDYVPSDQAATAGMLDEPRSLFVLSDYPADRLDPPLQERLVGQVAEGAGLVMFGGWESYHGCGGDWDGTLVGDTLPVEIDSRDDRVNCDHPVLLRQVANHPAVEGLPWQSRPPFIGGLNRFRAKADSTVALEAQHFRAFERDGEFGFEPTIRDSMLVVGRHGQGRTVALATDVAPHWVGGLVDWGETRVSAQAPGAEAVEVGDLYEKFFQQMLAWAGNV